MSKRDVRYPHTIGFRITDETWLRIEQEIKETDLTAHDWCRMVVLDRLDREYGFSKKERLLFNQIVRTQFLIAQGFSRSRQRQTDNRFVAEDTRVCKRKN
jgi:hypothetical protein